MINMSISNLDFLLQQIRCCIQQDDLAVVDFRAQNLVPSVLSFAAEQHDPTLELGLKKTKLNSWEDKPGFIQPDGQYIGLNGSDGCCLMSTLHPAMITIQHATRYMTCSRELTTYNWFKSHTSRNGYVWCILNRQDICNLLIKTLQMLLHTTKADLLLHKANGPIVSSNWPIQ